MSEKKEDSSIDTGPIFEKIDDERFLVRITIEKFIKELNRYSENPFDVDDVCKIRSKIPYFPADWDMDQLFLFLYSMLTRKNSSESMVVVVDEDKVVDWFYVIPILNKHSKKNSTLEYNLKFSLSPIKKSKNSLEMLDYLNNFILNYGSESILKNKLDDFSQKELKFTVGNYFFIPYDLIEFIARLKVPVFNNDALKYFEKIIAWYDYYIKPMPDFDPCGLTLRFSPHFFLFSLLNQLTNASDKMPVKELVEYALEFLEGRDFNILLLNNNMPVLFSSTVCENYLLKLHPVSLSNFKGTGWLKITDWNELYDVIKKKTGKDSIIIELEQINQIMTNFGDKKITLLEAYLDIFSMIYSAPCAIHYTLPKFLGIFGIKMAEGIKDFKIKFTNILNLLDAVLIVFLNENKSGNEILHISELYSKGNHINFKFLQHRNLKPYKYSGIETLKQIKVDCEAETSRKYNIVLGFKLNELKNNFSVEKMSELIGIQNLYSQLPMYTAITAIMMSMKAYDDDRFHPETPIINQTKSLEGEHFTDFMGDIELFLTEGIFILTEPGFPLNTIRSSKYHNKEFLGFDFEKLFKKSNQS